MLKYVKSLLPGALFIILGAPVFLERNFYSSKYNWHFDHGPYHEIIGLFFIGVGIFSILHKLLRIKSKREK